MTKRSITKIMRFSNFGFDFKPYNADYIFYHNLEFIDIVVNDLDAVEQSIELSKLYSPESNDQNWSGCFCFLGEFDKNIFNKSGILGMRRNHRMNLASIPNDELIWVRNTSYLGRESPFFSKFKFTRENEGQKYYYEKTKSSSHLFWVRMKVELALERTRIWKVKNPGKFIPEWLTEFYLMKDQYESLTAPSFKDKVYSHYYNAKLKLKGRKII